jgi:hypothetical protein
MTTPLAIPCTTPDCRVHTTMGVCPNCQKGKHPDPDVDGDRDRDTATPPLRDDGRGLGLGVRSRAVEQFADLRAAYYAGTLKPEPVRLGAIPPHFGEIERGVAEDVALLIGLRRAEGENGKIPYPALAPVAIGIVPNGDKRRASLALRRLVNTGVLLDAEPLKKFKRGDELLDGTKCYLPGGER